MWGKAMSSTPGNTGSDSNDDNLLRADSSQQDKLHDKVAGVRKKGSDAKWRANLRICQEILKYIDIPLELNASGVGRKPTKLRAMELTFAKIPMLEKVVSHLLQERNQRDVQPPVTLTDVRAEFVSLSEHVRHLQRCQKRPRLHTTDPSAQPIVCGHTTDPPAQPIVRRHTTNPAAQPIARRHATNPAAQPIVRQHTTDPPAQPIVRLHTTDPAQPIVRRLTADPAQPIVCRHTTDPPGQPIVCRLTADPAQPIVCRHTTEPPAQPIIRLYTSNPNAQPIIRHTAPHNIFLPPHVTSVPLRGRVSPQPLAPCPSLLRAPQVKRSLTLPSSTSLHVRRIDFGGQQTPHVHASVSAGSLPDSLTSDVSSPRGAVSNRDIFSSLSATNQSEEVGDNSSHVDRTVPVIESESCRQAHELTLDVPCAGQGQASNGQAFGESFMLLSIPNTDDNFHSTTSLDLNALIEGHTQASEPPLVYDDVFEVLETDEVMKIPADYQGLAVIPELDADSYLMYGGEPYEFYESESAKERDELASLSPGQVENAVLEEQPRCDYDWTHVLKGYNQSNDNP